VCRPEHKLVQLCRLLRRELGLKYIVYFATCACVDYFSRILPAVLPDSVTLVPLHGRMEAYGQLSPLLSTPSYHPRPAVYELRLDEEGDDLTEPESHHPGIRVVEEKELDHAV